MAWRFESKQPRAIPVSDGEQSFELRHKRLTGYEKLAIHEAITAGVVAVQRGVADAGGLGLSHITEILWAKVIGWEGVLDAAGNPKPFQTENAEGIKQTHLNEVMGEVPTKAIVRAVFLQLAINGIRLRAEVRELFAGVVDDDGFDKTLAEEVEDFLPKPSRTAEPCSKTSASTETATPSSV